MEFEGTWEGYYEYGDGYVLPQFGERVGFSVVIEGNQDRFTGVVTEDGSPFSVALQARIAGNVELNTVTFIKTYPKTPIFMEAGSPEINILDGEMEIYHSGYFDEKFRSMYGWWSITSEFEDEYGVFESTTSGIWFLKKS